MRDRVDQRLGNYRLIRLLGQGGFADIYLGEHVYLKNHAALKVLRTQLSGEDTHRFVQEAQTLARLSHPHIVRILDFAVQEGTPFLAMEYAPGGTLRTLHPKDTRLPLDTIVAYVSQITEALQYAHDQGLIHRDIKPENMLLGSHAEVLLSDFGLAMLAPHNSLQITQSVAGTIPYLAPEQVRGKPQQASDQYALGVVIYEWLCGTFPFRGSYIEIAMQHLSNSPPSLREQVPDLSPMIEAVVLRALAKEPEQRFPSVQDFATAFRFACQGTEIHLSSISVPDARAEARNSKTVSPPVHSKQGEPLALLLKTKLHIPRPRTKLVRRSHLTERIALGRESALTLISAPAGFGKTTLLAQWLAESGTPVAWLSLEEDDNDATRFLTYLIAALQTVDEQLGTAAFTMLHTPQPPPPETVLAVLMNDLMNREANDLILVLDDYHIITAEPIHRAMRYLVEHLPPQLHLVLATRSDPPLPLVRLRSRGYLTELRAADLRFETSEVDTFLHTVMGLDLLPEAVVSLQNRTEGWIAGLQFAALSLRGKDDITAFLAAFTGSHRYVLDYLSEEVLSLQPAPVQSFLLHTCILDRLSGPLCDAVTGQQEGQTMLDALDNANLFLVRLDDERHWYRYHHLFAEVLSNRLQQIESALVPELHLRASRWYEQQGFPLDAIRHAVAASDFEQAGRVLEQSIETMTRRGEIATFLSWVSILPQNTLDSLTRLGLHYVVNLAVLGQLERAESLLQEIELRLQQSTVNLSPDRQEKKHAALLSELNVTRLVVASFHGDVAQTLERARHALADLSPDELFLRSMVMIDIAAAYLFSGNMIAAYPAFEAAVPICQAAGNTYFVVSALCNLAVVSMQQGLLQQAVEEAQQALQFANEQGKDAFPIVMIACAVLGEVYYEWNQLETAKDYLLRSLEMSKQWESLTLLTDVHILLAQVRQAQGDGAGALEELQGMERHIRQYNARSKIALLKARQVQLHLVHSHLHEGERWLQNAGLSVDGPLSYLREPEYLTLAKVLLAQGKCDGAITLLHRLLEAAEADGRRKSVISILISQALAYQQPAELPRAITTLTRALSLAEPEGYIRVFLDAGQPLVALLRETYTRGITPHYIAMLLAAFGEQVKIHSSLPIVSASSLVEPLTEREREVLQLLIAGESNREIAHRLVISLNTAKKHVHNICGKLGVQTRTQAIARARTLNLF